MPHIILAPEAALEADPDAFQEPSLAEDHTSPDYYLPTEPSEHGRWVSPATLFDEVMQEFALAASEPLAPDPYDF